MYLYFNRTNGSFGKLGMEGIARVCGDLWNDHKRQAIEMLHTGDYCYIGNIVVVRAGNGMEIDALLALRK